MIKKYRRIGMMLLVWIGITYLSKYSALKDIDAYTIKEIIVSYGQLGPILFIIIFTIVPLTFFPDALLAVAAGMIFGFFKGLIYTMIGALCGATLAFYLARKLGQGWIQSKMRGSIFTFNETLQKNGFLIILLLRLIPLLPFDVISYSAGVTKIQYKKFLLATFLGTIPGIIVYVNLGTQSNHIGSTSFYVAIALLVGLIGVSFMLKNKVNLKITSKEK